MIFEIIMNNPDRDQYMSKSKDTVSVRLIDLGGKNINEIDILFFIHLWQKKKHQ